MSEPASGAGGRLEMPFAGPLFVVGSPRSGTSVLRLILTCNSRLVIPPECGFIVWLEPRYGDWAARDGADAGRIAAFVADLVACRKFETWRLDATEITAAITASRSRSYAELCAAVCRCFAAAAGKPDAVWGDKNNFYVRHLPLLAGRFGVAKFLHIVRDGRDVACSYREVMSRAFDSPYAPELPVDIESIARAWSEDVLGAADIVGQLEEARAMSLRYEDLVSFPEEVLRRVCSWVGVEYEPEMLAFHLENARSGLEPESTRAWKAKTFEPLDAGSVGRYAKDLAPGERGRFERLAGEALGQFGYL